MALDGAVRGSERSRAFRWSSKGIGRFGPRARRKRPARWPMAARVTRSPNDVPFASEVWAGRMPERGKSGNYEPSARPSYGPELTLARRVVKWKVSAGVHGHMAAAIDP
jgi:hypothetical protein